MQKQPFQMFFKIGVLKNFAIFTGRQTLDGALEFVRVP